MLFKGRLIQIFVLWFDNNESTQMIYADWYILFIIRKEINIDIFIDIYRKAFDMVNH